MAAAHVLAAYFESLDPDGQLVPGADFRLICEHHEDWALVRHDLAEIVSAKHKEPAFGAFTTLHSLLTDGGLLHLFNRWMALQMTPHCTLVTTAGLGGDAIQLQTACEALASGADADHLGGILSSLSAAIRRCRSASGGGELEAPATLAAFLASLTLRLGEPRRDHIPHAAPSLYARPVAVRLGKQEAAEAIWQSVLVLVRERMRAAGSTIRGGLPNMAARADDPLEGRSLALTQVDVVARVAVRHAASFTVLPAPRPLNRMAVKMDEGRCSDNAIARAEMLRLGYRRLAGRRAGTPEEAARRMRLQRLLLRIVDECTDKVAVQDKPWGTSLWRAVEGELRLLEGSGGAFDLDSDTLLGGVCDLANSCKVWFSPRFDVRARLRALQGERQ